MLQILYTLTYSTQKLHSEPKTVLHDLQPSNNGVNSASYLHSSGTIPVIGIEISSSFIYELKLSALHVPVFHLWSCCGFLLGLHRVTKDKL